MCDTTHFHCDLKSSKTKGDFVNTDTFSQKFNALKEGNFKNRVLQTLATQ